MSFVTLDCRAVARRVTQSDSSGKRLSILIFMRHQPVGQLGVSNEAYRKPSSSSARVGSLQESYVCIRVQHLEKWRNRRLCSNVGEWQADSSYC